jgi:HEAT repeat protein
VGGVAGGHLRIRFEVLLAIPKDPCRAAEPWRRLVPDIIGILEGDFPLGEDRRDLCCRPLRAIAVGTEQAPGAIRALEARLGDEEPAVRRAAARALAGFGAAAMPALPSLLAADAEARRADPALDRKYADWIGSIAAARLAASPPTR